eukprot:CCRYP_002324-RC/>CCRYP_002324-RC protein AED:0.11 eAED:0.11 QI:227/1/1/1/1/1/7/165/529
MASSERTRGKKWQRLLFFLTLALTLANIHVAAAAKRGIIVDETTVTVPTDEMKKPSLLTKMFPMISKMFIRTKDGLTFQQIIQTLDDLVDQKELSIFAVVGWGIVPVTKSFYELYANVTGRGLGYEEPVQEIKKAEKSKIREAYEVLTPWDDEKLEERIQGRISEFTDAAALRYKEEEEKRGVPVSGVNGTGPKMAKVKGFVPSKLKALFPEKGASQQKLPPFSESFLFHVVDHVSQASQIGFAVAVVDSVAHVMKLMGFTFQGWVDNSARLFSKVIYSGWITLRLTVLKRFILRKTLPNPGDMGKLEVVDDLLNGAFYLIWLFHMLDYFEVQTGLAIKSLFSVGATGTLVFGLASKDLASQLVSGLTLHLSEKMFEGDEVRFSDGTSGKIEHMGWMETQIRNSDELAVRIPNTQLAGQRVYNLSRTPRSQVKQTLRISYDDAPKIPKLLDNIKEEIRLSCPKLITDGSRAFRAHWQNFEDDHLQVVVDCHFTIKPTGDEYYDNRQAVLEAIHRAVKKTGAHFEVANKS